MTLYDITDLDEAMNAIKEEMMQERSESLLQEKTKSEYKLETIEFGQSI